jgi:hypothetical protein
MRVAWVYHNHPAVASVMGNLTRYHSHTRLHRHHSVLMETHPWPRPELPSSASPRLRLVHLRNTSRGLCLLALDDRKSRDLTGHVKTRSTRLSSMIQLHQWHFRLACCRRRIGTWTSLLQAQVCTSCLTLPPSDNPSHQLREIGHTPWTLPW